MFFSLPKFESSSESDAYAVEADLICRPVPELTGLLMRSRIVSVFAWVLGAIAASLTALHSTGQAENLSENVSFFGIGGFPGAMVCGILALGVGWRTSWGRIGCLVLSATLIGLPIWYASSSSHWNWNGASAAMAGRFLVGWIGMIFFFQAWELFGSHAIGQAILKDALEQAREKHMEETALLKAQEESLREAQRSNGGEVATESTEPADLPGSTDPQGPTRAA
ncbi:MAG: hypothetical protein GY930_15770 [bacterium]|nr:hypothetical protein [bacterium]